MNNVKGGYALIDCTGINLQAQSTVTITGLYARLSEAIKEQKFVLACNIEFGSGNKMTPVPVMVNFETTSANSDIVATSSTVQIWVDKDDVVTIVNMIQD